MSLYPRFNYRFYSSYPTVYYDKETAYAEYAKRLNWKNPQKIYCAMVVRNLLRSGFIPTLSQESSTRPRMPV